MKTDQDKPQIFIDQQYLDESQHIFQNSCLNQSQFQNNNLLLPQPLAVGTSQMDQDSSLNKHEDFVIFHQNKHLSTESPSPKNQLNRSINLIEEAQRSQNNDESPKKNDINTLQINHSEQQQQNFNLDSPPLQALMKSKKKKKISQVIPEVSIPTLPIQQANLLNLHQPIPNQNLLQVKNQPIRKLSIESSSCRRLCKICQDDGDDPEGMITPCKCKGSLMYVHKKCLKNWIIKQKLKDIHKAKCEICQYIYIQTQNFKYIFAFSNICQRDKINEILIFICLISILGGIAYAIYVLDKKGDLDEQKEDNKANEISSVIAIIFFAILILVLLFYLGLILFKLFWEKRLILWEISNYENKEKLLEQNSIRQLSNRSKEINNKEIKNCLSIQSPRPLQQANGHVESAVNYSIVNKKSTQKKNERRGNSQLRQRQLLQQLEERDIQKPIELNITNSVNNSMMNNSENPINQETNLPPIPIDIQIQN